MLKALSYFLIIIVFNFHTSASVLTSEPQAIEDSSVYIFASSPKTTTINILPIFPKTKDKVIFIYPIKNKILSFKTIDSYPIKTIYSYSSARGKILHHTSNANTYQKISDFAAEGKRLADNLTYTKAEYKIVSANQLLNILHENQIPNEKISFLKSNYKNEFNFILAIKPQYQESNSLSPAQLFVENSDKKIEAFDIGKKNTLIFLTESGQVESDNKGLLLQYSWPMYECKPCVNPIPSMKDLYQLGVNWYKRPKKGLMGLISPSAAIYVTSFLSTEKVANLTFIKTSKKNKFQMISEFYK